MSAELRQLTRALSFTCLVSIAFVFATFPDNTANSATPPKLSILPAADDALLNSFPIDAKFLVGFAKLLEAPEVRWFEATPEGEFIELAVDSEILGKNLKLAIYRPQEGLKANTNYRVEVWLDQQIVRSSLLRTGTAAAAPAHKPEEVTLRTFFAAPDTLSPCFGHSTGEQNLFLDIRPNTLTFSQAYALMTPAGDMLAAAIIPPPPEDHGVRIHVFLDEDKWGHDCYFFIPLNQAGQAPELHASDCLYPSVPSD